jgi:hypothetical protein
VSAHQSHLEGIVVDVLGSAPIALTRFSCSLAELVTGQPADAALGVMHYLKADAGATRIKMASGVEAIESEFEAMFAAARADGAADAVAAAEDALECCRYVLHGAAGTSAKLFSNSPFPRDSDGGGLRADRKRASGEGMRLADFCAAPESRLARLDPAHVAALRIYTTAAFTAINRPLRDQRRVQPHPLPTTVLFISEGISRLRAVGAAEEGANVELDLWRGLKDMAASEAFLANGGTELAPMSTTKSLRVAVQYAASDHPMLIKLRTDTFMVRGASIGWLSAFPAESETLYPPLTYLKPTGRAEDVEAGSRLFTVIEVKPHFGSA